MKSANLPALPAAAGVYRLRTAGVADPCAATARTGPADVLVALGGAGAGPGRRSIEVLAVERPGEVDAHPASQGAGVIDLTNSVLLPGMVNAHTHLDLTHLGPMPHDPGEGFVAWVDRVRAGRVGEAGAIRESVARGVGLSLRAGVVLVGDIAGAPGGRPRLEPFEELAASGLAGVSFVEFFAIGNGEAESLARVEAVLAGATVTRGPAPGGVRLGLQPHAPNTVGIAGYRRAVDLARRHGLPLSTHLGETPEEREFLAHARGPQRELLEHLGLWTDAMLGQVGRGATPIEHLAATLAEAPFLLAHVNDMGPDPARGLEILAASRASVAYCPRASEYFHATEHFGPHRYREMLGAGINVCLGTDSIVNLPRGVDSPEGSGLSVLDEARRLFARDGGDARTLLRMMTTHGCIALGWEASACSLAPGARPLGLVAVEVTGTPGDRMAWERILRSRAPARLVVLGTGAGGGE